MTEQVNSLPPLETVARNTLDVFEKISTDAEQALLDAPHLNAETLSRNTFTDQNVVRTTTLHNMDREASFRGLIEEPAIARVVARDQGGKVEVYFVTRNTTPNRTPPGCKVTSLDARMGSIAAQPVGDTLEIKTPSGTRCLTILERALLRPLRPTGDWDSVDTILEGDFKTITVKSLRALLAQALDGEDLDVLEAILARDDAKGNVIEGIRRSVISKMELRDQPILDKFQDAIFRLSLDKRLFLIGPPGTGKTTTLIRRLRQKLSFHLDDDENRLIRLAGTDVAHAQSWLMFTPTELLKQYIKEAFAREGVPAPEQRIATWAAYRRDLARTKFGILKTSTGPGSFTLTPAKTIANDNSLSRQTFWYSDFFEWQGQDYWSAMIASAEAISDHASAEASAIGRRLLTILKDRKPNAEGAAFVAISSLSSQIRLLADELKDDSDKAIQQSFNISYKSDPQFLGDLRKMLASLSSTTDDSEEIDAEDEDEAQPPTVGARAAVSAYGRAIRVLARADVAKRTLTKTSRSGRIVSWLDARLPAHPERLRIGENLRIQDALRRFLSPVGRYLNDISKRYRRYRKLRQSEGQWYLASGFSPSDISPLEIDLVLLAIMRTANALLADRAIAADLKNPALLALGQMSSLFRNQIMVDEATDFSPIQLACMGAMANPAIRSFFACGDFNQRITTWGVQSEEEFRWAFPDLDIRTIETTYRHSRQLNELARALVALSAGVELRAVLPPRVDNDGVNAVLGLGLASLEAKAEWIANRIVEIETLTRRLPSIAVLVNSDEEGDALAAKLNEQLAYHSIPVIACPNGRVIGSDNDVRVFDVQHIKGLEFEAVFFVSIDDLALEIPALFEKYLYVGATRAATYFGLTTTGSNLPTRIEALRPYFASAWGTTDLQPHASDQS